MSTVLYTAGESHLVVAADRVALTSDAALAGALWKELSAGRPTADVLDTMLRSGLGSLADLVLLDTVLVDAL